jgi:hypothetical protein
VTPEKTKQNQLPPERREHIRRPKDVRNLDVWSRCAPIRLAGCEDDPAESHILRGID